MKMKRLIRMTTGVAKGRYLLLDEDRGKIIHPNGYISLGCVLPWNGQWIFSSRPMPRWAAPYLA